MIERIYIKECLSFKEVELNLEKNLILFTGVSGSGKSLLIDAILTLFGYRDIKSLMIEATINKDLSLGDFGIWENDINVFKLIQNRKKRYYINNQIISKKKLKEISMKFIEFLNLKDFKEFENYNMIKLIDRIILKENKEYRVVLDSFKQTFNNLEFQKRKLLKLEKERENIEELKDFAKFEIDRIEAIDPKVGEYEMLLEEKKALSKKEKISEALQDISSIFNFDSKVVTLLDLLEKDSSFFTETMNELSLIVEEVRDKLEELEEIDIEAILNRIEELSSLNKRYGSIEEAIKYKEKRIEELNSYREIDISLNEVKKSIEKLEREIRNLSKRLSREREKGVIILEKEINRYLDMLYLENLKIELEKRELDRLGEDSVTIHLGKTNLEKVSSGEFNRVRLALLATSTKFFINKGGVLILDEIDSNLSGKEAMGVAKVLKELSKNYQILAISHQPQLASFADKHFLVFKDKNQSFVKEIKGEKRIFELARMVSGDEVKEEAIRFAKSLLE